MSREIKFRVWDKKTNCYDDFNCIKIDGNGVVFDKDYDWQEEIWYDKADEEHNFVIEQYTGLKDKNGKEIYEGDIVRYLSYRKEYIGQIMFDFVDDSEGYYVEKHYGWGIRRDNYNLSLGDYADDNMKCELVEVIGNIHENPELLGDEK